MPNEVQISGRLGADPVEVPPEPKGGKRYCYFDIAHSASAKFRPTWLRVVCYGGVCRIVMDDLKLKKGEMCLIYGRLKSGRIHMKELDKDLKTTEIFARRVYPGLARDNEKDIPNPRNRGHEDNKTHQPRKKQKPPAEEV